MITEERCIELETHHRSDSCPARVELQELVAAYRLTQVDAGMQAIILEAQGILSSYIVPDSGVSDHEVINQLLGLLDGARCRRALSRGPAAAGVSEERRKAVPLEPTAEMKTEGGRRLLSFQDGSTDDSFSALQWSAVRNEAERVWRSMWLAARDEGGAK